MRFPNSASSSAAKVFYLPSGGTHSDTEGKKKARVRNMFLNLKNTIFNEHSVSENNGLAFFFFHTIPLFFIYFSKKKLKINEMKDTYISE